MTAREIATRLIGSAHGVTPTRVEKAKALASRSGVAWADVLATLSAEDRAQVEAVHD